MNTKVPTPTPDDPFYSVSTVSKMLDVGSPQVRNWIKEGKLEAHMVAGRWRVLKSALKKFVNQEYGDS